MVSERDENLAMLLERGMDPKEAENFLEPGNKIVKLDLHLPPTTLIDTLRALAKLSIMTEPVKVSFTIISNRYKEFIETAECASGRQVVDATRKPGELVN